MEVPCDLEGLLIQGLWPLPFDVRSRRQQVALLHEELGHERHARAAARDRERLLYKREPLGRASSPNARSGLNVEEEWPEDRRGPESLIHAHALADLLNTVVMSAYRRSRRPAEARPHRPPDRELVILRDVQHASRPLPGELWLAPPEVEEAGVEEGVGHCEGMLE